MMKFQRFAFILLSIMLVLAACSKSEDKPEKRQRPAAAKVVDLGEDNHEEKDEPAADEVKKVANRQRPAISSKKAPSRGRNAERQAEKRDDDNKKDDAPKDEPKPEVTKKTDEKSENAKPVEQTKIENAENFDFSNEQTNEEPTPRIVKKREGLDIENIINIRELREQTGYVGALTQTDLVGQASDARYNVIRLSTDKTSELGFTVQVWKPGNESAASKRYEEIYKQSFGGIKQKDVASDAFIASHHSITELGFYDKAKRTVVLISCSDTVCKADQLKSIATTIQRRL
ncbi:MAG: hypothetical protein IIY06_04570 [Proteobacteria bacterium]|jgi:hypothetical protein|nr:hypothetical protein [Pseudomonadota bacterium]